MLRMVCPHCKRKVSPVVKHRENSYLKLTTEILLPFPKIAYRLLKGKNITCPTCGKSGLLWPDHPEAKRILQAHRPWWKLF